MKEELLDGGISARCQKRASRRWKKAKSFPVLVYTIDQRPPFKIVQNYVPLRLFYVFHSVPASFHPNCSAKRRKRRMCGFFL